MIRVYFAKCTSISYLIKKIKANNIRYYFRKSEGFVRNIKK